MNIFLGRKIEMFDDKKRYVLTSLALGKALDENEPYLRRYREFFLSLFLFYLLFLGEVYTR